MNFKKQKISKHPPKVPKPKLPEIPKVKETYTKMEPENKDRKWLFWTITLIILLPLGAFTYKLFAQDLSPSQIITKTIINTVGAPIDKDKDGYTNFLAMGVGGEGHIAENLTDTIIITSVNQKTGAVVMTSLPRDLYVKHENIGGHKINSVFQRVSLRDGKEEAYTTMEEIAEEITGLDIHYYAKIDFNGLKQVVDALGGVDIYIEETIYDPYYPTESYGYETFSLGKGLQHVDGETALKYVRSRKTTSDFDRSSRQQKLLFAIKEQALQSKVLTNRNKLTNLLQSVDENLETDLNLREMISLSSMAIDVQSDKIINLVIHDDPNRKGGFLYTPPRSQYGDAFVLLPAGNNYSQIQGLIDLHRKYPEAMLSENPIELLNATLQTGLAGTTKQIMQRFGFNIINIDNAENRNLEETTIIKPESVSNNSAKAIQVIINGKIETKPSPQTEVLKTDPTTAETPTTPIDNTTIVNLGQDFIERHNELEVYSKLVPIIQQAIEENRAAQEEEDEEETGEETKNTEDPERTLESAEDFIIINPTSERQ